MFAQPKKSVEEAESEHLRRCARVVTCYIVSQHLSDRFLNAIQKFLKGKNKWQVYPLIFARHFYRPFQSGTTMFQAHVHFPEDFDAAIFTPPPPAWIPMPLSNRFSLIFLLSLSFACEHLLPVFCESQRVFWNLKLFTTPWLRFVLLKLCCLFPSFLQEFFVLECPILSVMGRDWFYQYLESALCLVL